MNNASLSRNPREKAAIRGGHRSEGCTVFVLISEFYILPTPPVPSWTGGSSVPLRWGCQGCVSPARLVQRALRAELRGDRAPACAGGARCWVGGLRSSRGCGQRPRSAVQQRLWTARAGTPLRRAAACIRAAWRQPRRRRPCRSTLLGAVIPLGCATRPPDQPRVVRFPPSTRTFLTVDRPSQKADKFGKQVWLVDARDKVRPSNSRMGWVCQAYCDLVCSVHCSRWRLTAECDRF